MKLSFRPSAWFVLCVLALLILALVALSPGFVWSQTVWQQPSVPSRVGLRVGAPAAAPPVEAKVGP